MSTAPHSSNSLDISSILETNKESLAPPRPYSGGGYTDAIAATKKEIENLKEKLRKTKEHLADASCNLNFLL